MNPESTQLQIALNLAFAAHQNQQDKGGMPYILHPMRLMFQFDDIQLQIIALLHDAIEDSDITEVDLLMHGFTEETIAAIVALTKQTGERYDDFIERVAQNDLARQVKIADIQDNLNISRLPTLGHGDLERIAKYHRALKRLERDDG